MNLVHRGGGGGGGAFSLGTLFTMKCVGVGGGVFLMRTLLTLTTAFKRLVTSVITEQVRNKTYTEENTHHS